MKLDEAKFEALFIPPAGEGKRCIIRAVDVRKIYRMGTVETHALRGATLDIYAGEYLSIMGPSGSGKSTLFNMIGALAKPTSGKVYIDQVDIAQLDCEELAWLRKYCPVATLGGGSVLVYRFDDAPSSAPGPERPVSPCFGDAVSTDRS